MKILQLFCLSLLVSCATSYQKQGLTGGYDNMNLGNDLHQVSFRGNAFTSREVVQKGFMRRCAEVTLENDMHSFVFVEKEGATTRQLMSTNNYYTGTNTLQSTSKHERVGIIKLFKKNKRPASAIDAKVLLSNFGEE